MTMSTRGDRGRKFFRVSPSSGANPSVFTLSNEGDFIGDRLQRFHPMNEKVRGFSEHRKDIRPVFSHKAKNGGKPNDIQAENSFLLVTDGAKAVFEDVDAPAFDFLAADVRYEDGRGSSRQWLCDVTRVLDALDEAQSDAMIIPGHLKIYYLAGAGKLVFDDRVPENCHIFRMAHAERMIICDDLLRTRCKEAKITGLSFTDAIELR